MSRGDIIGGAAVPLTDALPWDASSRRTFLVNDSMGTDGRFLLYTLASQVLSSSDSSTASSNTTASNQRRGRVLWLGCGPVAEGQILQGLKKIGCDKTALSQAAATFKQTGDTTKKESSSLLTIRSLAAELSASLLVDGDEQFNEQELVKRLYRYILQEWLPTDTKDGKSYNNWIVVDDASALANLLGEKLVYGLLLALNAQSHQDTSKDRNNSNALFGLVVRCSNDYEAVSLPSFAGTSVASSGPPEWFGAGGHSSAHSHHYSPTMDAVIPWERSLLELADGVLDVLPLTSGYTRELHGRIVMTQMPQGRGWSGDGGESRDTTTSSRRTTPQKHPWPMQIINYCITDQKIVAYLI